MAVSACAVPLLLLSLCWHVQISIRPLRWPPLDFGWKDDERGHYLTAVEAAACLVAVPAVLWLCRRRVAATCRSCTPRAAGVSLAVVSVLAVALWVGVLRSPPCTGWLRTDVGFIRPRGPRAQHAGDMQRGRVGAPRCRRNRGLFLRAG